MCQFQESRILDHYIEGNEDGLPEEPPLISIID